MYKVLDTLGFPYIFEICLFFLGIGVAMTKDPATLMVGQYFKRKRELMEIVLTSATGLGLASVAAFVLFSVG